MELPLSWYPIYPSLQLAPNKVVAVEAFGRKLSLFRTSKNQLGLLDAQCCHIGADLTRGQVENGALVCPLHNWHFDPNGKCTHIPCQTHIPRNIRQPSFRCKEQYGVIYAYLGEGEEEEVFTLPTYSNIAHSVVSAPQHLDFNAPYEMAAVNSFDQQHLTIVHRRELLNGQKITSNSPYHFAIEYRAKVIPKTIYDKVLHIIGKSQVHMRLDCWGGNILMFSHLGTPNRMIISLLPLSDNLTRAYITSVLPRTKKAIFLPLQWVFVRLLNHFTMRFVNQDIKALEGINFRFINVLPEADNTMISWYKYWKKLPRIDISKIGRHKAPSPSHNK